MNCEKAAEFVSALYDRERIPRDVAAHIGNCEDCQSRLKEYSSLANELRRLASLEPEPTPKTGVWRNIRRVPSSLWQRGLTTMRIPRIAFVSMFVAILLLSGGLVVVRARAGSTGPILELTYKLPNGTTSRELLTTDPASTRSRVSAGLLLPGLLALNTRVIANDGDRTELAIQANYNPEYTRMEFTYSQLQLKDVPEQLVWIHAGETRQILVSGLGIIELTAQYLDHIPPLVYQPKETLDPQPKEFRVVTPVLLRDNRVIANMDGNSIYCCSSNATLMLYVPGEGRYLVSALPFEGAIEGNVHLGQIDFSLENHRYLLLTSTPITRSEHVWVTHEPDFKPSERMVRSSETRDDQPMFLVRNLEKLQQPRIQH